MKSAVMTICVGILGFTYLAGADIVNLYPVADAWIEKNSETNHGSDANLQVREDSESYPMRSILLRWDLSSLAGATINSVEFWVYTTSASTTLYPHAYKLTSAWDESTVTWTKRTSTENWGTAGGDYTDDIMTLTWNIYVNKYKSIIEGGTDVDFNALVQEWVDNSSSNYGIYIKRPIAGTRQGSFGSREHTYQPYLKIDYTPVPEPASMAVLAVGLLMALSGRKK